MWDPVQIALETLPIVSKEGQRKYYRFRPTGFYGGIATADCVGCNLRCIFCWSWQNIINPEAGGYFHTPAQVAGNLIRIARQKGFQKVRISGSEPTIDREHLLAILSQIPLDIQFVLETNGILIGNDETYAQELAKFENLRVRVSFKGASPEEFSRLTQADPQAFFFQVKAVENLFRAKVRVSPALMSSFSTVESIKNLQQLLGEIHPGFRSIEMEQLVLYGEVQDRLKKSGISPISD